jgi:hypothetical protein
MEMATRKLRERAGSSRETVMVGVVVEDGEQVLGRPPVPSPNRDRSVDHGGMDPGAGVEPEVGECVLEPAAEQLELTVVLLSYMFRRLMGDEGFDPRDKIVESGAVHGLLQFAAPGIGVCPSGPHPHCG